MTIDTIIIFIAVTIIMIATILYLFRTKIISLPGREFTASIIVSIIGALGVVFSAIVANINSSAINENLLPTTIPQTSITAIIFPTPLGSTSSPTVISTTEPTSTVVPATPTEYINTPSEEVLEIGQTWRNDGLELTLVSVEFFPDEVRLFYRLKNASNKNLVVDFGERNFNVKDNLGRILGFQPCSRVNTIIEPQQTIDLDCLSGGSGLRVQVDVSDPQINSIIVTVSDISRIEQAQWKVSLTSIR